MVLTESILKSWYKEFNELYFGNELPKTTTITINNRCTKRLGMCSLPSGAIEITTTYDRSEENYKETLIHEMLHLYTYIKYKYVGHSKYFKTIGNYLNAKYGFHISTYASLKDEGITPISRKKREKSNYRLFEMPQIGKQTFVCLIGDNFPTKTLDYYIKLHNASVHHVDNNSPYLKSFAVRRTALRGKILANDSVELANIKSAII